MALEIKVSFIEIYDDSKLIISQLLLQYDVKYECEKQRLGVILLLCSNFFHIHPIIYEHQFRKGTFVDQS